MDTNNKYDTIRHCPGSDAITSKVLRQIKLKAPEPKIANLVRGTGEQALLLAKEYKNSHITAVDEYAMFFSSIEAKAKQSRVQGKIKNTYVSTY